MFNLILTICTAVPMGEPACETAVVEFTNPVACLVSLPGLTHIAFERAEQAGAFVLSVGAKCVVAGEAV